MATQTHDHLFKRIAHVATWPPLVYFLLGFVCLGMWAAGTSIQVQTSEAWIRGQLRQKYGQQYRY